MGKPQAVVGLAAIAAAAGVTNETTHESYHTVCDRCADMEGFSEKDPEHEDCTGKCAQTGRNGRLDCAGPCACKCNIPLSKNEIMKLRSLVNKLTSL